MLWTSFNLRLKFVENNFKMSTSNENKETIQQVNILSIYLFIYSIYSNLIKLKIYSFSNTGQMQPLHRGAFWQFPFRWIYCCHSSKSTGNETGKTHLCALPKQIQFSWKEFKMSTSKENKETTWLNLIHLIFKYWPVVCTMYPLP